MQSVQDYCFSSMQIFDALVVVVPASAPGYIKPQQSGCLMSRTYCWCMHCTLCACAFHFDSLFCRPPHVCFFILFFFFFLRPVHVRISFGLIFLPSSSRTFFIFNHFYRREITKFDFSSDARQHTMMLIFKFLNFENFDTT